MRALELEISRPLNVNDYTAATWTAAMMASRCAYHIL